MLNLLSKQGVPQGSDGSSAGFLFFETADGYHFKSIEGLLKQNKRNHMFLTIPLMHKEFLLVMMERYWIINRIVQSMFNQR